MTSSRRPLPHHGTASLLIPLAFAALGSAPDSQVNYDSIDGNPGSQLGRSTVTGDFDGDGKDDLAFGAPGQGSGVVHLRLGNGQQGGITAPAAAARFGHSLAAGDLDGDGRDDLVVGAPDASSGGLAGNGAVYVYRNWNSLFPWPSSASSFGDASDESFGETVAVLPDTNGDGVLEFAAAAPLATGGYFETFPGNAVGVTAAATRTQVAVGAIATRFGRVLVGGDFDGDGFGDVAAGYQAVVGGVITYSVGVHDGPLFNISSIDSVSGISADNAGDLNGDGAEELVTCSGSTMSVNTFRIRDVSARKTIYSKNSPDDMMGLSSHVHTIGDVNGDGYREYLWGDEGTVRMIAGGSEITQFHTFPDTRLGIEMMDGIVVNSALWGGAGGDLNGDGVQDWAMGLPNNDSLLLYSAALLSDVAGPQSSMVLFGRGISVSENTTTTVFMDAGAGAAGLTWLVLGSTEWLPPPGVPLDDGSGYPLNPYDSAGLWLATADDPHSFVTNNYGSLNGKGHAIGRSDIPAGTFGPSWVGLEVYYGMFTTDPVDGSTGNGTDFAPQVVTTVID